MLFSEYIRSVYDPERAEFIIKVVNTLVTLGQRTFEDSLEATMLTADEESALEVQTLQNNIINNELVYVLDDFGIRFGEDDELSLIQLFDVLEACLLIEKWEVGEELQDVLDSAHEDNEALLLELLAVVKPEPTTGQWEDYFNVLEDVSDTFFKKVELIIDGTRSRLVTGEAVTSQKSIAEPTWKGEIWTWIKDSGRVRYDFEAALRYHEDDLLASLSDHPTDLEINDLVRELKTLIEFSNAPETDPMVILEGYFQDELRVLQVATNSVALLSIF